MENKASVAISVGVGCSPKPDRHHRLTGTVPPLPSFFVTFVTFVTFVSSW